MNVCTVVASIAHWNNECLFTTSTKKFAEFFIPAKSLKWILSVCLHFSPHQTMHCSQDNHLLESALTFKWRLFLQRLNSYDERKSKFKYLTAAFLCSLNPFLFHLLLSWRQSSMFAVLFSDWTILGFQVCFSINLSSLINKSAVKKRELILMIKLY